MTSDSPCTFSASFRAIFPNPTRPRTAYYPVDRRLRGPVPGPAADFGIVAQQPARQGEKHREGVLSDFVLAVGRDVDDHDPLLGRRLDIDCVQADPVLTQRDARLSEVHDDIFRVIGAY